MAVRIEVYVEEFNMDLEESADGSFLASDVLVVDASRHSGPINIKSLLNKCKDRKQYGYSLICSEPYSREHYGVMYRDDRELTHSFIVDKGDHSEIYYGLNHIHISYMNYIKVQPIGFRKAETVDVELLTGTQFRSYDKEFVAGQMSFPKRNTIYFESLLVNNGVYMRIKVPNDRVSSWLVVKTETVLTIFDEELTYKL